MVLVAALICTMILPLIAQDEVVVRSLDAINTPAAEYGPCFIHGDSLLLFASDRKGGLEYVEYFKASSNPVGSMFNGIATDGQIRVGNHDAYDLSDKRQISSYVPSHDFWEYRIHRSAVRNELTTKLVRNCNEMNTPEAEGYATYRIDGNVVYYSGCDRSGGFGSCDLWFLQLGDSTAFVTVNLGNKINSEYWESCPALSADGNSLFFISNRPTSTNDDGEFSKKRRPSSLNRIYRAELYSINGLKSWGRAVQIEFQKQLPFSVLSPCLLPDNVTMILSVYQHPAGQGGWDYCVTKYIGGVDTIDHDIWSYPIPISGPVNSKSNDFGICFSKDAKEAIISSDRNGNLDLFSVTGLNIDLSSSVVLQSIADSTGQDLYGEFVVVNTHNEKRSTYRSTENHPKVRHVMTPSDFIQRVGDEDHILTQATLGITWTQTGGQPVQRSVVVGNPDALKATRSPADAFDELIELFIE